MLPQIKARESLNNMTIVALGNGRVKEIEQRRIIRDWERTANDGHRQKLSKGQAGIMLAGMGIKLEIQKHG